MIDYQKIADAIEHYKKYGFELIDVPWCVVEEANRVTLPKHIARVETPWGDLIGSAEQGFIDLMIDSLMPHGRYMAVSPCFRIEEQYSELTRPYFMKLELIEYRPAHPWSNSPAQSPTLACEFMIEAAMAFFSSYVRCDRIPMENESTDIVTPDGIELGSYGMRSFKTHKWVYGTGLAEPRLSSAIEILGRKANVK